MTATATKRYWSALEVGEDLPPLVKAPLTRVQVARYAGASGHFGRMHLDEPFARESGMPAVSVPGMLVLGFLGQLLGDWAGGPLLSLTGRFVKIVWPGDVISCRGRVASLDHHKGRYTAEVDLWAENQKGELVVKGCGIVQLFHSAEDESRQARGDGPLVIAEAPPPALEARIGQPMAPIRGRRSRARAGRKPTKKASGTRAGTDGSRTRPKTARRTATRSGGGTAARTARKKTSTRKTAARKKTTGAKKTATRKTTARKKTTGRKKTATRKPATRKKPTGRKKTATRKTTARKKTATRKKPAARRTATRKKTTASKTAARRKSAPRKKPSRRR